MNLEFKIFYEEKRTTPFVMDDRPTRYPVYCVRTEEQTMLTTNQRDEGDFKVRQRFFLELMSYFSFKSHDVECIGFR